MQAEYQSPESRTAAIEGSYSYTESAGRSLGRSQRANIAPSEFFRYRMVKRCCDVFLVLISMPVMLPILGVGVGGGDVEFAWSHLLFASADPQKRCVLLDVEVPHNVREFG